MDASFYLPLKQVHVASVHLSFALFLLRGMLMLADSPWPRHWTLRVIPHVVDTILLASALLLMAVVHQYPFVHHWLTVKVLLLAIYIVLGSFTLKRGRTKCARAACFVAAAGVFLFIYSVAWSRHPLGILRALAD